MTREENMNNIEFDENYTNQQIKLGARVELENLYRYHKGEATILDFMVMAYNKAISDALHSVRLKQDTRFSAMVDIDSILDLKID